MQLTATRTYLELTDPGQLKVSWVTDSAVRVERVTNCPPSFWRYLYTEVGRRHYWIDRLPWTDGDIRRYLGDPAIQLWVMTVSGAPAGYFELRRDDKGGVEVAYFGLLEHFIGRGLGGHLLSEAATRAWEFDANRVWLHTSTLDHPAAIQNYLKRGFTIVRREQYEVSTS
jgi:GNAT superfamily N-acetyltransferase